MNIAAYCRVSTDKSDQLNSLETQKKFFLEYTEKNNHNLVRLYADEGISGTKIKNRKEFLRLLNDAKHGLFDMVVVKDISRFARNTVDLLQSIRTLKALGIETIFLTANMSVLGQSEFVLTIFGALAQEESANTSKRVKFGKKMNAEKGRVPNIVYGYNKTIGDYFNLQVNSQEAAIVRQIFNWYTEEGYGANKIALMLNERGVKTKRSCKWSQNAVCRILTNEIYIGRIVNGKEEVQDFLTGVRREKDESEWIIADKPELKIISNEQFYQVQKILAGRKDAFHMKTERQSNRYLFSTLLKCKDCGYSFRRTVRTYQNTYIRWVCSGRNANGMDSCHNKTSVDEGQLIKALEDYFSGVLKNKDKIIRNVVQQFSKLYKEKDENEHYEKELQAQYDKLKHTKNKFMDMYTEDLISKEDLKERLGTIKTEMDRLENQLKMVRYNISKTDQLEPIIARTFKDIEDLVSMKDMTNAQLKKVISRIEVSEDGSLDVYLKLFSDLGLQDTVLVSDNRTQGCNRPPNAD